MVIKQQNNKDGVKSQGGQNKGFPMSKSDGNIIKDGVKGNNKAQPQVGGGATTTQNNQRMEKEGVKQQQEQKQQQDQKLSGQTVVEKEPSKVARMFKRAVHYMVDIAALGTITYYLYETTIKGKSFVEATKQIYQPTLQKIGTMFENAPLVKQAVEYCMIHQNLVVGAIAGIGAGLLISAAAYTPRISKKIGIFAGVGSFTALSTYKLLTAGLSTGIMPFVGYLGLGIFAYITTTSIVDFIGSMKPHEKASKLGKAIISRVGKGCKKLMQSIEKRRKKKSAEEKSSNKPKKPENKKDENKPTPDESSITSIFIEGIKDLFSPITTIKEKLMKAKGKEDHPANH